MQQLDQFVIHPISKLGKSLMKKCTKVCRLATSASRSTPHFIIIGAMKAGTTSLFGYLGRHPQILKGPKKEVHYFDQKYRRGQYYYRSNFPLTAEIQSGSITGEATPLYLFHPHVPERIHNLVPDAKLIAVLRNPTKRAISDYFHQVRRHRESLPMMEAFLAEEERTSQGWGKMLRDKNFTSRSCMSFSYKKRSIYVEQLERYWEFFPKEQLMVLTSEALFSDPQGTYKRVLNFLGVSGDFNMTEFIPRNVGTNKTEVPASVRKYLDDYFAPFNQKLYERIGQDFGWSK